MKKQLKSIMKDGKGWRDKIFYIGFPPIKGRISEKRKWALRISYVFIGYGFASLVQGIEFWLVTGYWVGFVAGLSTLMITIFYYLMIAERHL